MSGDCGGSHYVAYEYENGANANVWIDVGTARAWICGTPSSIGGPAVFGLDYDIWSGWAGPNSCGFQADQSTHFWLTGVFDDWAYTNIDS
jgi:hypothetical protein